MTCWTSAPGTSLVGPVEQAPVVLAQPGCGSGDVHYSYSCNTGTNTNSMDVTLTWKWLERRAIIFTGTVLRWARSDGQRHIDYNAPLKVDLVYELEAPQAVGSTAPVYVTVSARNKFFQRTPNTRFFEAGCLCYL